MPLTLTSFLNLFKPEVGVISDWAAKWNQNADKIDSAVKSNSDAAAAASSAAAAAQGTANAAMPKGGGTFTGNIQTPYFLTTGITLQADPNGGIVFQDRSIDATKTFYNTGGVFRLYDNKAGRDIFQIDNTGAIVTPKYGDIGAVAAAALPKTGGKITGDLELNSVNDYDRNLTFTRVGIATCRLVVGQDRTFFINNQTDNLYFGFQPNGDMVLPILGMSVKTYIDNAKAAAIAAATAAARVPAGVIADWASPNAAPTGWLKCNGATVSRASYPDLFAAIGGTYGAPDGNTFSLPDVRGLFRRGMDEGRGVDGGRGYGSVQGSQNLSHTHIPGNGGIFITSGSGANVGGGEYLGGVSTTAASGGAEARPINIAFPAIIKY